MNSAQLLTETTLSSNPNNLNFVLLQAKGVLKNGHTQRKIQDCYNHLVNLSEDAKQTTWLRNSTRDLENLLLLLRT